MLDIHYIDEGEVGVDRSEVEMVHLELDARAPPFNETDALGVNRDGMDIVSYTNDGRHAAFKLEFPPDTAPHVLEGHMRQEELFRSSATPPRVSSTQPADSMTRPMDGLLCIQRSFCNPGCLAVLATGAFFIFAAVAVLGATNLDNCRGEPLISVWLTLYGTLGAIASGLSAYQLFGLCCSAEEGLIRWGSADAQGDEEQGCVDCSITWIKNSIGIVLLLSLIVGSIYVYSAKLTHQDTTALNYCSQNVYATAFIFITVNYVIVSSVMVVFSIVCLCTCCVICCGFLKYS